MLGFFFISGRSSEKKTTGKERKIVMFIKSKTEEEKGHETEVKETQYKLCPMPIQLIHHTQDKRKVMKYVPFIKD